MPEQHPSQGTPEDREPGLGSEPRSIIESYFLHGVAQPVPEAVKAAADIIAGPFREIERTGDAYTICWDLVGGVHDATTVLAEMIRVKHQAINPRWLADPERVRSLLLMTGQIECGGLRAQQTSIDRGPNFPGLPERLAKVEQLIDALQQ